VFGLVFLFGRAVLQGFGSAVPHVDAPTSMKARPTPGDRIPLASAPKVAALAVFTRVAAGPHFPGILSQWQQVVVFVAIRLDGAGIVRRHRPEEYQAGLMAYSSIGHMGFALVGLGCRHGRKAPRVCWSTSQFMWR